MKLTSAVPEENIAPATRILEQRLRRLTDGWPGATLGALVYGAWAVFVNWGAGAPTALRIGAAHWLMSTLLTYYGTALMRSFFSVARDRKDGAVLAFVGGMGLTYSVLIAVHHSIGTPHIALTLAAGVVPTFLFCSGYAMLLFRTSPAAGTEV